MRSVEQDFLLSIHQLTFLEPCWTDMKS